MTKLDDILSRKNLIFTEISLVCLYTGDFFIERKRKMKLEFSINNAILTAKVSGELDHHIAKELREKIDMKLSTGIYNVLIFDFSDLDFMDSSGIAVIMGRVKYMDAVSGSVKIIVKDDNILRILKMSGISSFVEFI